MDEADIERRKARGAGRRVRRIGVAMEEFRRTVRRRIDYRAVDAVAHRDRPHGQRAISKGLGHGDEIGRHAE